MRACGHATLSTLTLDTVDMAVWTATTCKRPMRFCTATWLRPRPRKMEPKMTAEPMEAPRRAKFVALSRKLQEAGSVRMGCRQAQKRTRLALQPSAQSGDSDDSVLRSPLAQGPLEQQLHLPEEAAARRLQTGSVDELVVQEGPRGAALAVGTAQEVHGLLDESVQASTRGCLGLLGRIVDGHEVN